jgi:hypothetical protein
MEVIAMPLTPEMVASMTLTDKLAYINRRPELRERINAGMIDQLIRDGWDGTPLELSPAIPAKPATLPDTVPSPAACMAMKQVMAIMALKRRRR